MSFFVIILRQFRFSQVLLVLLLFVTTWGMLLSCSPSVENVKNLRLGKGEQIIILGDSIASGYGVRLEEAFPSVLSRRLNVPILNRGVAGDTTAIGLSRLETDVLTQNPWLVMVELGGNDYLQQIPETETKQNLRQIVTRIQAQGAMVVVLGVNVGLVGDNHEQMFKSLAQETQAYLIPQILKGILSNPKYRQDDVIHPNAAGHQVVGDRVFQQLQPLLQKATIPASLRSLRIAS